ncbi:MAG: RNA polymerase sigma factor [Bacteroidales bacterium]|nr:RNA polymerase sigma factor [Bacteroidales bacterium]
MKSQEFIIHKDLIEGSKKGDTGSQYKLYGLYSKAMYNLSFRMMNSVVEAEDVLQEAFTEAFLKLKSYKYEASFGAWLKRIVINKCLNKLKKRNIQMIGVDEKDLPDSFEEDDEQNIDYEVDKIITGVQKLPDGYRVILELYLFEGYDHVEISQILEISVSTSKSQYSRAKKRLKSILNDGK